MTRYTVVWVQSAEKELTEIWLNALDRKAVSTASDAIDQILAIDATDRGVELSEGLLALFSPPLKVIFSTREQDRLVEVLRVLTL